MSTLGDSISGVVTALSVFCVNTIQFVFSFVLYCILLKEYNTNDAIQHTNLTRHTSNNTPNCTPRIRTLCIKELRVTTGCGIIEKKNGGISMSIVDILNECRALRVLVRQLNAVLDSVSDGWCGMRTSTIKDTVCFGCDMIAAASDRVEFYNNLIDRTEERIDKLTLEIKTAFKNTSPTEQTVIMLYYVEAMKDQDIAPRIGTARRATVNGIRHDAIKKVNILDAYVSSVL